MSYNLASYLAPFISLWGAFIVFTGIVWITVVALRFWRDVHNACNTVQRFKARSSDDSGAGKRDTGKRK